MAERVHASDNKMMSLYWFLIFDLWLPNNASFHKMPMHVQSFSTKIISVSRQQTGVKERLPRMWTFFINALNRSFKALSSYIFMSKDHISPNRSWVIFYKNVGEDALQYDHLVFHLRYIPEELSIKWKIFTSKLTRFYIKASFIYGFKKSRLKGKGHFCF